MRKWLFFLTKPLLEETDGDLTHGEAISGGFRFYLAVEIIGDLERCFHKASLLYCWPKARVSFENLGATWDVWNLFWCNR